MIRQAELQTALTLGKRVTDLGKSPDVQAYEAAQKALRDHLAELKKRHVVQGEPVAEGRLQLRVKKSLAVQWEKVLRGLHAIPAIGKALTGSREARKLMAAAEAKDTSSGLVEQRVSIEVVHAEAEA